MKTNNINYFKKELISEKPNWLILEILWGEGGNETWKEDIEDFLESYDLKETFNNWMNSSKEERKKKTIVDVA